MATRGSLHLLERRLSERGHLVLTYRIGPLPLNLGGIREAAGVIARKVEMLIEQTPVRAVNVVGHSMGGLVGLYYVKHLGGRDRVRKLILLGSPVNGTWSAVLGLITAPLGRASLQLLPGSGLLRELRDSPLAAAGAGGDGRRRPRLRGARRDDPAARRAPPDPAHHALGPAGRSRWWPRPSDPCCAEPERDPDKSER